MFFMNTQYLLTKTMSIIRKHKFFSYLTFGAVVLRSNNDNFLMFLSSITLLMTLLSIFSVMHLKKYLKPVFDQKLYVGIKNTAIFWSKTNSLNFGVPHSSVFFLKNKEFRIISYSSEKTTQFRPIINVLLGSPYSLSRIIRCATVDSRVKDYPV